MAKEPDAPLERASQTGPDESAMAGSGAQDSRAYAGAPIRSAALARHISPPRNLNCAKTHAAARDAVRAEIHVSMEFARQPFS